MTTRWTLTVTAPDVEQPVVSGARVESALNLSKFFHKLAAGNQLGAVVLEARNSGVRSSATATCASVQNADTVSINSTALTATQHHARGTITPTVSGIDVDDTVTIQGVALTAKQHYAKGTITCAAADAADNVTIGATTFVGTAGAVVLGEATYSVDTGNTEAATSLAAQINAHAVASTIVTASSSSAVVTVRAVASGIAGNSIVLTSTDGTDLAVSGSGTLAGATAVGADQFDISGTNAQCCTSLLAAIQANATLAALVTAKASATVVTIRSILAGTGGNAYTLVSSDAQLAVSGAGTMTGGATVGNNQFDFGGTDTETATALAAAINASSTALIGSQVTASSSGAVVTVTAKVPGVSGNAIEFVSSDGTRLAVTGSGRLASGSETLITLNY